MYVYKVVILLLKVIGLIKSPLFLFNTYIVFYMVAPCKVGSTFTKGLLPYLFFPFYFYNNLRNNFL